MSESTAPEPKPVTGRAARYQRKAEQYKAQLEATEKALAEAMPGGAEQIVAIMLGAYRYEAVNSKTGEVVELKPAPADVIKAFEVAANRILGKPISVKEVYQESHQTRRTLLIVGAAADLERANRGEDSSGVIEAAAVPSPLPAPATDPVSAPTPSPSLPCPTTTTHSPSLLPTLTTHSPSTTPASTTTDYLPPTDSHSHSLLLSQPARPNLTNPARERRLARQARKHQEEEEGR